MDLTTTLGAPSPIQLGGNTYQLSSLTLGDMATFRQWANERHLATADARVAYLKDKQCLSPEERHRTYATAFDQTKNGVAEAIAAASLEGGEQLILLSLKHRQPDMTLEALRPLLTMADVEDVRDKVEILSGFADDDDAAGAGQGEGAADPNEQTPAAAADTGAAPSGVDSSATPRKRSSSRTISARGKSPG